MTISVEPATATAAPPAKPDPVAGRPVTVAEVLVYSDPGCSSCSGRGLMTKIVGRKPLLDKDGKPVLRKGKKRRPRFEDVKKQETCGCAWRRFREAFGGITVEVKEIDSKTQTRKTSLFWPAGETLEQLGLPIHASTANGRPACVDTEADIVRTDRTLTCPACQKRHDQAAATTAENEAIAKAVAESSAAELELRRHRIEHGITDEQLARSAQGMSEQGAQDLRETEAD